jgi:hypothetical protein
MAVRQNIVVSNNNATALYSALADLRAGTNQQASAEAAAAALADKTSLLGTLAEQLKSADKEKSAILLKNIEGFVQGALENTELTNYEKQTGAKLNFVVKTNRDLLGKMLVQAKLMLAAQGVSAVMNIRNPKTDVPYSRELNPMNAEETMAALSAEKNAQLEKAMQLINSLNDVQASEAFSVIQETINLLDSLIETDALSPSAKPIALSELLSMLALKADFMPGAVSTDLVDGAKDMAAKTRAFLAAA